MFDAARKQFDRVAAVRKRGERPRPVEARHFRRLRHRWLTPTAEPAPRHSIPDAKKESRSKKLEHLFASQLDQVPKLVFERQVRFAKSIKRQWRFDFAFPEYRLAVELDGVVVTRINGVIVTLGGHASIDGIRKGYEKINHAAMLGWTVLHFLQGDVAPRHAINMTLRVLAQRGWRA